MLILKIKDVELCQVIIKKAKQEKKCSGLSYRGYLFVKIGSYSKDERDSAIKKCRQLLDKETPITTIVVETAHNFTLWSHERSLKRKKSSQKIELKSPFRELKIPKKSQKTQIFKQVINNLNKQTILEVQEQWEEEASKFLANFSTEDRSN